MNATVTTKRRKLAYWRRWIHRPQQVWLRKAFFQIHLWSGIIVGLYIIAIGVSGSILVFKEELMPRPRVSVPAVDTRACTPEGLETMVERVNAAFPKQVVFLTACPSEFNPLYTITIRDRPETGPPHGAPPRPPQPGQHEEELTVYAHPVTGEILGTADRESSWVHWIQDLHFDLLSGRTGRFWNGVGGAALLALSLTGIILWWPGLSRWTRSLVVDFRRGWKRINWDLHSAIGFWTFLFSLIWAVTGMYFTWPDLLRKPIAAVSEIRTANYPAERMRQINARPVPEPGELDVMATLRSAQKISPDAALEGYFYGRGKRAIFTVYMAHGRMGDYANTDFIYFDQNTGEHLHTWRRGRNETAGDWAMWLVTPLHFGTSWGLAVKWLWFFAGLVLPALTITGFLAYWNRYLSKKLKTWKTRRIEASAPRGTGAMLESP